MSRSETHPAEKRRVALDALRDELERIDSDLRSSRLELSHAADELVDRTRALDRCERLCEAVLAAVGTGVVLVDGSRVHPCNAAASNLLHLPRMSTTGSRLDRLRAPLAKPIADAVRRAREEGTTVESEIDVSRQDQVEKFRFRAVALSEDDEPEVVVTIDNDCAASSRSTARQ